MAYDDFERLGANEKKRAESRDFPWSDPRGLANKVRWLKSCTWNNFHQFVT